VDPELGSGGLLKGGAHSGSVFDLAFSPDGARLASVSSVTGGEAPTLEVWDVAERRILRREVLRDDPHRVVFSPDGRLVGVGLRDGTARLWLLDVPGAPAEPTARAR